MMKTKIRKKIQNMTTITLLAAMLVPSIAIPASAAENKTKETGTKKEEVVYINLNSNGTVGDTYVVNSFAGGSITDYGMYSNVKVLNTTDKIHQEGDTITLNSNADKVYYKGELDGAEIPWNISVKYYLNDTEYTQESLLGKSGDLKIKLKITKNKACEGNFYDNYALQTNITLDTERYTDIKAKDATIANVGSKKQLTFTSLPGQGLNTEITARVLNFEMDEIQINGIQMNLNVKVDDKELMSEVNELIDAVDKLDKGADKINQGTSTLKNGGSRVSEGASSLESGAESLNSGAKNLQKGINQLQAGLDELDKQSGNLTAGSKKMKDALKKLKDALEGVSASAEDIEKLVSASSQIKEGIDQIAEGSKELETAANYETFQKTLKEKGLDLNQLKSGNDQAIASLQNMISRADRLESVLQKTGLPTDKISPIKGECEDLANQMITLLQGNNAALDAMKAYLDGMEDGATKLATGAENLQEQYKKFDEAIGELAKTLTNLMSQMTELKKAINTLAEEYSKLDDGINAYTKGVNSAATGNKKIAKGAGELSSGSEKLRQGSNTLSNGTVELVSGIVKLYDATNQLKDGTGKMKNETSGMDKKVEDKIDAMLKEISSDDKEKMSFVSNKNTKVDSVQFVIQTKAVHEEKEEAVKVKQQKKGFFQKLKQLF